MSRRPAGGSRTTMPESASPDELGYIEARGISKQFGATRH